MPGRSEIRVVGASATGSAHRRSGMPNQDAVRWSSNAARGSPVTVAAVADGHGGPRSFRSADGARLAAECAIEVLGHHAEVIDAATLRALTERWAEAVREDVASRPIGDDERTTARARGRSLAMDTIETAPLVAYGTTLLAVVVSETAVHYLQLGDGDILAITNDGHVHRPLPTDDRLLGDRTTSLSQRDAWRDVRLVHVDRHEAPRLVLLCTDGYTDSFVDDDAFFQAGTDFLAMVDRDGIDVVGSRLETWLAETTELGAGDDATVALVDVGPRERGLPVVTGGSQTRRGLRFAATLAAVALLAVAGLLVGRSLWSAPPADDAPPTEEVVDGQAPAPEPRWVVSDGDAALELREGGELVARVALSAAVIDAAPVDGGMWVLLEGGEATGVRTADPRSPTVVRVSGAPSRLVVDDDTVWLIDAARGESWGIDQRTGELVAGTADERAVPEQPGRQRADPDPGLRPPQLPGVLDDAPIRKDGVAPPDDVEDRAGSITA